MAGVFRANIFEREQFGADGTIAPLDPLSANIVETSTTLGISVGRWR